MTLFTCYILSMCFGRMHRRIVHPVSRGFLYELSKLGPQDVDDAFKSFSANPPENDRPRTMSHMDATLGHTLNELGADEVAQLMGTGAGDEGLSALLGIFQKSEAKPGQTPQPVYTEKTCSAFHLLLVGTVQRYGEAISNLCYQASLLRKAAGETTPDGEESKGKNLKPKAKKTKPPKTHKLLTNYAETAWKYARLLHLIAYSRMLRLHLHALSEKLSLPKASDANAASAYTGSWVEDGAHKSPTAGDGMELDPEAELTFLGSEAFATDKPTAFRRWLRIQASYFASVDSLSSYCANPAVKVDNTLTVSVLCIKPSGVKTPTWDYMKTIITQLPSKKAADFKPETIISQLEKIIDNFDPKTSQNQPCMLSKFKSIAKTNKPPGSGPRKYDGPVHCEAGWAALKSFPGAAKISTGAKQLVEVRSSLR
jgi:hypothetical protein